MTDPRLNEEQSLEATGPGPALFVGVALILCALWMFVWRGSLDGVFHFDDFGNIVDNQRVRRLWPLDDFLVNNRPVGLYSFAVNYHFSGEKPLPYHFVNLAIHMVNGLLLYTGSLLTMRLLGRGQGRAGGTGAANGLREIGLAGLISTAWVVHPLTTQAVTNIVQRYEALSSMGYLGAWVGLAMYLGGSRRIGCCLILLAAWIGLMSKEVFATAPVVILLFDRLVTRQSWSTVIRSRWLPYLLMCSPYLWFIPSVARFFDPVRTRGSSMGLGMKSISAWEYLRTQPEVLLHYLRLVVWPRDLCFDYLWRIQNDPKIFLSLGGLTLAVLVFACRCYLRGLARDESGGDNAMRIGLAGWLGLAFFLILAPTSSFMPIADLAVEHRMYLASAVVVGAIVPLISQFAGTLLRNSERPTVLRVAYACIIAAAIGSLAWRTHLRNLDYRDGVVLWSSATRISPENPRAWYNLGRELYHRGHKQAAIRPMISAVGFSGSSVPMYDVGLADCLRDLGRSQDAITLYRRAISRKHEYPEAHNNLGAVYLKQGDLDEARKAFEIAVALNHPESKYNLALVHLKQDHPERAIPLLEEVVAKHPEFPVAVRQLAWTLATVEDERLRDVPRARRMLREHYDLGSTRSVYVLDAYAAIQAAAGEFPSALRTARQALALAEASANPALVGELNRRIERYQAHLPWIGGIQP